MHEVVNINQHKMIDGYIVNAYIALAWFGKAGLLLSNHRGGSTTYFLECACIINGASLFSSACLINIKLI